MPSKPLPMSTTDDTTLTHELNMVMREACVLDQLYSLHKDRKDALARLFRPGEKHDVTNAQGLRMGSMSLSQPNKKAVCTDESILVGTAEAKGMELIDHLPAEGTPEYVEAIEVLREHAEHLLPPPTISRDDAAELASEALEQWQITGRAPLGWEITDASKPRFTVSKPRDAAGRAAMRHLIGQVHNILEIEQPKEQDNG